jgi:DNA-binding response OmpR family regulator
MAYNLQLLKKLTVLFIEDDDVIRSQTQDVLKIFFANVLTAQNGLEGIGMLENKTPDIILSDIKMPVMDGLTFTKKVRDTNNQIPIILLSSYSDQQMLFKAANSGIDGFVLKPIELDNLLETFDRVLQRKVPTRKYYTFSDGLTYNILTEELYKNGELLELGKKEKNMLKLFIQNFDKTLTKEEIIATIWEMEAVTDSALKNLLSRLRGKIGFDIIVSVKGSGWRLNTAR